MIAGCATLLAARAEALTLSTWLGGTGVWSDPLQWSSNPLYPCNGNGGDTFDIAIGSGTVTQDLDCDVEAFTLSAGTLTGAFELTVNQLLTWTGGTMSGGGTTSAMNGITLGGTGVKSLLGTRILDLAGGSGVWSAGNVSLGSDGSTLRVAPGATLTATGGSNRSLTDTNDSGTFVNEGTLSLGLDAATTLLTVSTGTFTHTGAVHVNTGILAIDAGGSFTGSFDGAGTLRVSGSAQDLATGSSVTVADLEVTGGGALTVETGASVAVGNLDVTGAGTLSVPDAGTTVAAVTATQSSGTLTGAGTLETSGLLTWSGGTMSGSGTTRATGGLALTGGGVKNLLGTRTLAIEGGTSTWSAGSVNLGSGGATLHIEPGAALAATGATTRTLSDTTDLGVLLNEGTLSVDIDPSASLTVSTGTLTHSGAMQVNTGTLVIDADGTFTGSVVGAGTLRTAGGSQSLASGSSVTVADLEVTGGGALTVETGASVAVGNLDVTGAGTLSVADAGTTVAAVTATQSSGTLTGAGALETSGLLTWSGGTMSGSGTTRATGGLALTGGGVKNLLGTRTLAIEGGTSTWSAGSVNLGSGAATFHIASGASLTAIGSTSRTLSDTSNAGTFLNDGTFVLNLDTPALVLTASPGTITNAGTLELVTGRLHVQGDFTQTAGAIRLAGGSISATTTDLDLQGGALEGSGLVDSDVACACAIAPGLSAGQLDVDGDLTLLPGGELRAEIGGLAQGSEHDRVEVSGSASLGGVLSVAFLNGFEDDIGPLDQLAILEATSGPAVSGGFANAPSGLRVLAAPGWDSVVVSYGPGSALGENRVVLHDFEAFRSITPLDVAGTAQGGTIMLTIFGNPIEVTTISGQTPEQVAEAIAAAVRAVLALSTLGIAGIADGAHVDINALVQGEVVVSDPGITVTFTHAVPSLPGIAIAALALVLAATGAWRARHSSRAIHT